jgi:beta-phosphoglucomutase-like phosphatase (HAD superfamily)
MSLRAILLDVDGTVADTENLGHRPAYNRAFRQLGVGFRWGPKLYRKLLQQPGGRERLLHYLRHYQPELGPQAEAVDSDMEAWVDQVHALKTRYFKTYVRRGRVPLRSGVARLIHEAKSAGVRVALVSNASPGSIRAMLHYGMGPQLIGSLDLIVSGRDVQHKKPSPEPYLHALRELGLAPWECVALEDSAMGLQAAVAAGIPAVITRNSNTTDHDFSAAALVLDGLGEPGEPAAIVRGRLSSDYLSLGDLDQITQLATARAA